MDIVFSLIGVNHSLFNGPQTGGRLPGIEPHRGLL